MFSEAVLDPALPEDWPGDANAFHEHGPITSVYYNEAMACSEDDFAQMLPLPNVWLGVSVEDQRRADERVPLLLQTPAAVRFLSCEPLLGPVDLAPLADHIYQELSRWYTKDAFDPTGSQPVKERRGGYFPRVDWVIIGGESGPGARPMAVEWAWDLVHQCQAAGVACFVKQLGAHPYVENANVFDWPEAFEVDGFGAPPAGVEAVASASLRLRDRKGGNPDEWPEALRVRDYPA